MTSTNDPFVDKELGISEGNIRSNSSISSEKQENLPDQKHPHEDDFGREDGIAEENESSDDVAPSEPSDEVNLTSCLQVLGAFFLMFNSWGIANTFGAFQTYYEGNLLSDQSPSNISWIGSIQAFLLLFLGGLCTGPIFDAGYMRELVVVGSLLAVLGMMMTSICQEYWYVVLRAVISEP